MRIICIMVIMFSLLAAGCASQGAAGKTKMSSRYHKKEYPKSQANINSLQYASKRKTKKNKQGFFKRIFPGKKSSYASN